jgi:hypothetical protein
MYAVVFALVVIGLAVLIFRASQAPSRHSQVSPPAQMEGPGARPSLNVKHVRSPVENPSAEIFVLGSDPGLRDQASQDLEIYRKQFPTAQARSIATVHQLFAQVSNRPCHIAHVLNKFDDSGRVIWEEGEGDVLEVLRAFSEGGAYFVFLASGSGEGRQEVIDEILRARSLLEKPRLALAILVDRGAEFAPFLREFAKELRKGEGPALAWLHVRPQDSGGPQPKVDHGPNGVLAT